MTTVDTLKRHATEPVYHTAAILTPDGLRHTCTVLAPESAKCIDSVGSVYHTTPQAAENEARRLYAIALSVKQMQERRMERAA